jgi:hypothetical protein
MKKIAHKGNFNGSNKELENTPQHILEALARGYEVEIDLWYTPGNSGMAGTYWLGHDEPRYQVPVAFLLMGGLWIHVKSYATLHALQLLQDVHPKVLLNYFWHQTDKYVLTSQQYIWTCDLQTVGDNVVLMIPNITNGEQLCDILHEYNITASKVYGICADALHWEYKYESTKYFRKSMSIVSDTVTVKYAF